MLSNVFLSDRDAALELDLDLCLSDDDLLDQRSHDGRIVCAHDRAVFDAVLEGVEDDPELCVLICCLCLVSFCTFLLYHCKNAKSTARLGSFGTDWRTTKKRTA